LRKMKKLRICLINSENETEGSNLINIRSIARYKNGRRRKF
jgi:hypothetical protein